MMNFEKGRRGSEICFSKSCTIESRNISRRARYSTAELQISIELEGRVKKFEAEPVRLIFVNHGLPRAKVGGNARARLSECEGSGKLSKT